MPTSNKRAIADLIEGLESILYYVMDTGCAPYLYEHEGAYDVGCVDRITDDNHNELLLRSLQKQLLATGYPVPDAWLSLKASVCNPRGFSRETGKWTIEVHQAASKETADAIIAEISLAWLRADLEAEIAEDAEAIPGDKAKKTWVHFEVPDDPGVINLVNAYAVERKKPKSGKGLRVLAREIVEKDLGEDATPGAVTKGMNRIVEGRKRWLRTLPFTVNGEL